MDLLQNLFPLSTYLGLYMVGSKGERGPAGPPGRCSCNSLMSSPFDDSARSQQARVPAVRSGDEGYAQYYISTYPPCVQ